MRWDISSLTQNCTKYTSCYIRCFTQCILQYFKALKKKTRYTAKLRKLLVSQTFLSSYSEILIVSKNVSWTSEWTMWKIYKTYYRCNNYVARKVWFCVSAWTWRHRHSHLNGLVTQGSTSDWGDCLLFMLLVSCDNCMENVVLYTNSY